MFCCTEVASEIHSPSPASAKEAWLKESRALQHHDSPSDVGFTPYTEAEQSGQPSTGVGTASKPRPGASVASDGESRPEDCCQ